mgnify:CR=1 FL=1
MLFVQWRRHHLALANRADDAARQHIGLATGVIIADGVNLAVSKAKYRHLLLWLGNKLINSVMILQWIWWKLMNSQNMS